MSGCELLGGFSWFIQFLLLVFSLGSLLFKRWRESPRRSLDVWLMDTSKQAIGGGSEHFINLALASLFGGDEGGQGDPCVWYFLSGFMGFAFGTPFAFVMTKLITKIAKKFRIKQIENTGVYNDKLLGKPKVSWWFAQLTVWILVIILQRICMGLIFSVPWCHEVLGQFGTLVLSPVQDTFYAKIIVVLVILPLIINCAEFWVQDNFLMEQNKKTRRVRHMSSMNLRLNSSKDFESSFPRPAIELQRVVDDEGNIIELRSGSGEANILPGPTIDDEGNVVDPGSLAIELSPEPLYPENTSNNLPAYILTPKVVS